MQKHVVVIDDSDMDLDVISAGIKSCGMKASVFYNSIEANEVLFGEKVDLVLLDIEMPFVHGTVKAKVLKEHPETRDIPLWLISGKSDEEMQELVLECNADGYLKKPIARTVLQQKLKELFLETSEGNNHDA